MFAAPSPVLGAVWLAVLTEERLGPSVTAMLAGSKAEPIGIVRGAPPVGVADSSTTTKIPHPQASRGQRRFRLPPGGIEARISALVISQAGAIAIRNCCEAQIGLRIWECMLG